MSTPRPSAAHASVAYFRIPEFAQAPVAEQARLKARLEGALAAALSGFDEARRIVLEAPDGAAVLVLGDPAAALDIARRASAGDEATRVAAGLGHGPVRVAEGNAASVVLGDAIATADAVAGFAPPGRIAATREFRDALARASPARAQAMAPAGTHTDARERSYEVFLADPRYATSRRRRRFLAIAVACAAIVGVGLVARLARAPDAVAVAPPRAAVAVKPAAPATPAPATTAPATTAPAPVALATLRLEIRPAGEILIDGTVKGRTPPLTSLQIAPGKHRIEIRRAGSTSLVLQVDAGPGEELVIRHTFAAPPPKSAWRRFFDQFK